MIDSAYTGNGSINGNGNGTSLLHRTYASQLADILAAERHAAEVFPDMASIATDEALSSAFRAAASETEIQLARLDRLVESLQLPLDGSERSEGNGSLDEARTVLGRAGRDDTDDPDAALLRVGRQTLRYQIAGYEAACATARRLGDYRTLDVLLLSLDEELALDASLSSIASRSSRLQRTI